MGREEGRELGQSRNRKQEYFVGVFRSQWKGRAALLTACATRPWKIYGENSSSQGAGLVAAERLGYGQAEPLSRSCNRLIAAVLRFSEATKSKTRACWQFRGTPSPLI